MVLDTHQQLTCTVLVRGGTALWVAGSRRSVPRLTEQHPGTGIRMAHMPPKTAKKNHVTWSTRRDFLLLGALRGIKIWRTLSVTRNFICGNFVVVSCNNLKYKIIVRDFEAANVSTKCVTYISALWRARGNRPSRFLLKSGSHDSPFQYAWMLNWPNPFFSCIVCHYCLKCVKIRKTRPTLCA